MKKAVDSDISVESSEDFDKNKIFPKNEKQMTEKQLEVVKEQRKTKREHLYGWGNFTPKFLQVFAKPIWALVFLCAQPFLQGAIVNGALRQFSPMLEHRFRLSSLKSGFIMTMFDVACVLCLVPVTYFGGARSSNRPHYIGIGTVILGIGSTIFSLPAFLTGPYNPGNSDLCSNIEKEETKESSENYKLMYSLLLMGNFLHGVGATPYLTLGVSYIDDFVEKSKASIYLGVFYMMPIIGPAVGFLCSFAVTNIHVDFLRPSYEINRDITPSNNNWVAAWWLVFVVGAMLAFIIAIPVSGLPKKLAHMQRKESIIAGEPPPSYKNQPKLNLLIPSILQILQNTPFMFLTLAGCCEGIILAGMSAFFPKILNIQFGIPLGQVGTIMGSVVVPSCLMGLLLGGFIIKKKNLTTTSILKLCMLLTSIAATLQLTFLIHCRQNTPKDLQRVIQTSNMELMDWGLTAKCNEHCHCGETMYSAICDVNDNSYYSPCHAGCKEVQIVSPLTKHYYNCSCVNTHSDDGWSARTCESLCSNWKIVLFLIGTFAYQTSTFCACIPALTATLRSIPHDLKSLALGIQWFLVRTLGSVPSPVTYGHVIDKACSTSVEENACVIYDENLLSAYIALFNGSTKIVQLLCFFVSYKFYQRLRKAEEEKMTGNKSSVSPRK